jgi:hypothetical protein
MPNNVVLLSEILAAPAPSPPATPLKALALHDDDDDREGDAAAAAAAAAGQAQESRATAKLSQRVLDLGRSQGQEDKAVDAEKTAIDEVI